MENSKSHPDKIKERNQFRVLIVYPNLPLMLLVPVAVGIFTKLFKDQGYIVELFDTTFYKDDDQLAAYSEEREQMLNQRIVKSEVHQPVKTGMVEAFREKVEIFKPDFMIGTVVEDAFFRMLKLLRGIEDFNVPHLIGGVFPTYAPEKAMEFEEIKMIGIGEGEKTAIEVSEAVRQNLPIDDIKAIWYRDSENIVQKNPAQPLVDINEVIPDYSLFDDNRFWRPLGGRNFKILPVETYRGCPYTCTFCNSPGQLSFAKENNLGNFLRRKTMSNLHAELKDFVANYSPTAIFFVDDSFLARPRQEIFDFCDMYEDISLPFWFNSRAENCEADTLARLKEVGCYRMTFGIECGNEEYRAKVLDRHITNEKYIKHFKIINQSGIPWNFNVILGLPGETRELVMDTVEVCRQIPGYDSLGVSIFTPYSGAELRNLCLKNGWMDDQILSGHIASQSVLKMPPPCLTADEISTLAQVFPLYCYYPKSEWDRIKRSEIPDERGQALREELKEDYRKNFLGETQKSPAEKVVGGSGCRTNPKDAFIKY
jgi:anaerobic magnesium-protoporphyrin IX monomethyl ester cyclase